MDDNNRFVKMMESYIKILENENDKLKAENEELKQGLFTSDVDELKADNKRLKGLLDMDSSLDDAIIKDAELIRGLKAELKALRSKEWDMQAEIKELKADITHDAKVSYDLDDKHVVIIKELEEENESLKSNSLKHSSLKEYKQEAEEYFHHNPKAKSVSFYMLDDCDVDEIDGSQHDPIVIIYNDNM